MRFLVRLSNRNGSSPADRKQISKATYEAVRHFGADVGNLRISSSAIELDLLLNSEQTLQESLKILESQIGPLLTLRKLDVPSPLMLDEEAIKVGLDLFSQERYWESHEALESAWRNAQGDEKEVLQGLILVAAALVHWQKNEKQVTLNVMKRARDKLVPHQKEYFGVNLGALTDMLRRMLESGEPRFFKLAELKTENHRNSDTL